MDAGVNGSQLKVRVDPGEGASSSRPGRTSLLRRSEAAPCLEPGVDKEAGGVDTPWLAGSVRQGSIISPYGPTALLPLLLCS